MKILIVAVFCAFFAVASSEEFNSTMPSQLTGKVLIEMESDELNMKLSTVEIINERHIRRCFGVLIARDRVAMPESCWDEDLERWARVGCWKEEQKELYYRELKMVKPIPENNRLYIAAGIVEVQLKKEVDKVCWPPGEGRYITSAERLKNLQDNVTVVGLNEDKTEIITKPYILGAIYPNIILIAERKTGPKPIPVFTSGEPLFYQEEIGGIFMKDVIFPTTKDGKTFVRLQKKCIRYTDKAETSKGKKMWRN